MRRLLLALFPASWRARYGEEFEALLGERPLGPFDVADVLLAAVDAHLNLRGLAAADHAKGFVMTLRLGGIAAVLGGLLWATGLIWSSSDEGEGPGPGIWLFLAGTALLLVALIGLSAFQSRAHPRLVWAAFVLPAAGAVVSFIGAIAMALGDQPVLGRFAGWDLWFIGVATLVLGSGLFAIASGRSGSVSRAGSALLGASAVLFIVMFPAVTGLMEIPWEPIVSIGFGGLLIAFAGGWIVLGIGAIRADRPVQLASTGGAS